MVQQAFFHSLRADYTAIRSRKLGRYEPSIVTGIALHKDDKNDELSNFADIDPHNDDENDPPGLCSLCESTDATAL